MFFVAGSQRGGGSLMGGWSNGFPSQGLPHGSCDKTAPMLCVPSYWSMAFGALSVSISNDTTRVRVNGTRVDPFVEPFSGNYDLFSFNNVNRRGDSFGVYGQNCNYVGGLEYGEILLYTNRLSDAEIAHVEAYLGRRWFNRKDDTYVAASPTSVAVASGARITVDGDPLETSELGGAGTIDGSVILGEGGTVRVDVPETGLPECPLSVTGTVTLPAEGSIAYSGSVRSIKPGTYVLLEASSLVGSVSGWTVPRPKSSRQAFLAIEGNRLILRICQAGTFIIVH